MKPVKSKFYDLIDSIWQLLYWKVCAHTYVMLKTPNPYTAIMTQVVLIDRRKKIESGQRITSFSWLLNDKRGVIGRMLSAIKPENRELSFMVGQLGKLFYSLVSALPRC